MRESHFHIKPDEQKNNFIMGTETDLAEHIITHFCPPGSTVLDMSGKVMIHYNDNATIICIIKTYQLYMFSVHRVTQWRSVHSSPQVREKCGLCFRE